jgi:hypothetical protein
MADLRLNFFQNVVILLVQIEPHFEDAIIMPESEGPDRHLPHVLIESRQIGAREAANVTLKQLKELERGGPLVRCAFPALVQQRPK